MRLNIGTARPTPPIIGVAHRSMRPRQASFRSRHLPARSPTAGTPSDPSIVECITALKARGFRVVFYPFILMYAPGKPWRGRITYSPDVSAAASAVVAFLGSATT